MPQGSSFKVFGRGNCLEYSLPQRPDLIIMEHLPYLEGEEDTDLNLEILLNRLRFTLNFTLLPPIIFMNMIRLTEECDADIKAPECGTSPKACVIQVGRGGRLLKG